jgi:hypothetical protein
MQRLVHTVSAPIQLDASELKQAQRLSQARHASMQLDLYHEQAIQITPASRQLGTVVQCQLWEALPQEHLVHALVIVVECVGKRFTAAEAWEALL